MNEDKLKKAKNIFGTSDEFRTYFKDHVAAIKSNPNIDKHKITFGAPDTRFIALSLNFSITQYRGSYGSSSCSTTGLGKNVSNDVLQRALNSFLNKNVEFVMDGIADELDIIANAEKQECYKQIIDMQNAYKDLFSEDLV